MEIGAATVGRWVLGGAAVYAVYGLLVYLLQGTLLYPGRHLDFGETGVPPSAAEVWWIESGDARVEAWLLQPEGAREAPGDSDGPVVIAAHGNAEDIGRLRSGVDGFLEMGASVLLVEYPGYGRSSGTPTQERITAVFAAAYDRLTDQVGVHPDRIVAYGRSIGGAVVAQLAAERTFLALILQSTPASVAEFAWQFALPPLLVRDPFRTIAALRGYEGSVLIVHGKHDREVPFTHAERIAAACDTAEIRAYDCGHNDCPPDAEVFWDDVRGFLQENGYAIRTPLRD